VSATFCGKALPNEYEFLSKRIIKLLTNKKNKKKPTNKRPRGHIAHLIHIGKYFAYEHMQRYFSLLPLDHPASKFELFFFGSVGFEKIFKDFPH
jgi:hypothetical protein